MCTILQLGKKAPMFRIFNNSLYFFCSLKNYNLLCHFTVVVVVVSLMLLCIVLFAALIQIQNRVNIIRFILKSPSQTSQLSCSVLDYIFVVVFVGLGEGCGSFSFHCLKWKSTTCVTDCEIHKHWRESHIFKRPLNNKSQWFPWFCLHTSHTHTHICLFRSFQLFCGRLFVYLFIW